jgi:hypothetical protein
MADLTVAETTADPCCAPEQQANCCEPSARADRVELGVARSVKRVLKMPSDEQPTAKQTGVREGLGQVPT